MGKAEVGSVRLRGGDQAKPWRQRWPEAREQRREGPVQHPRNQALQISSRRPLWKQACSPKVSEEGKLRQGETGKRRSDRRESR